MDSFTQSTSGITVGIELSLIIIGILLGIFYSPRARDRVYEDFIRDVTFVLPDLQSPAGGNERKVNERVAFDTGLDGDSFISRQFVERQLRVPIQSFDKENPSPIIEQYDGNAVQVCGYVDLTYYLQKSTIFRPLLFAKATRHTDRFIVLGSQTISFTAAIGKNAINKHGFTTMNGYMSYYPAPKRSDDKNCLRGCVIL